VGIDPKQIPGSQVGHGQWETVTQVAEAEMALVVGGSYVVGSLRKGLGSAGVSALEAPPGVDKSFSAKDAAGGGG